MPRIRQVKPQFWLDENLAGLPRDCRLLYIGLWNLADDYGVFEWRPARIQVQLFPWDADLKNGEILEWLNLLCGTSDLIYFEADGKPYGFIRSFCEHQVIKKPSHWRYAIPPVGNQLPTTTPPVPLGSRVLGSKEQGSRVVSGDLEPSFVKYLHELSSRYPTLNIDACWLDCQTWYIDKGKVMSNAKMCLNNWCKKELEIGRPNKQNGPKPLPTAQELKEGWK